jgi:hypothetical protein
MRTIYDGDRADICTLNHVGGLMVSMLAWKAMIKEIFKKRSKLTL